MPCTGCLPSYGLYVRNARTTVEFRDPGLVAVEADTPTGRRTLLPPGHEVLDVDVPHTEPPMSQDVRVEGSLGRRYGGGIVIRCTGCNTMPFLEPLRGSTTMVFDGAELASNVLTFEGHDLRIPFAYHWATYRSWIGSHGMSHVDETHGGDAFRVDLVTPLSNVIRVREVTDDHREEGKHAIKVGVALLAAGAVLSAVGVYSGTRLSSTDIGLPTLGLAAGGGLGLVGLFLGYSWTSTGIDVANASVWDRTVYPAPASTPH